eukprot:Amastigsp_a509413_144.p3 type:complete len:193 gc:universal Amastigsp_a509413_144:981-403(-)
MCGSRRERGGRHASASSFGSAKSPRRTSLRSKRCCPSSCLTCSPKSGFVSTTPSRTLTGQQSSDTVLCCWLDRALPLSPLQSCQLAWGASLCSACTRPARALVSRSEQCISNRSTRRRCVAPSSSSARAFLARARMPCCWWATSTFARFATSAPVASSRTTASQRWRPSSATCGLCSGQTSQATRSTRRPIP